MSNRNVPFFRSYLRVLGAVISYNEAARRFGLSNAWIFKCLSASRAAATTPEVPSVFLFEAEDGDEDGPKWFHQHVKEVLDMSIENIDAGCRAEALNGTWQTSMFQGRTVYKLAPDWIDEGLRDMLGLTEKDMYLKDAKGNLVPERVWIKGSTDLKIAVLSAYARRYKKTNSGGTTVNVNASSGVQVISRPAPAIAAPLPALENVTQADFEDVDDGPADISAGDTDPDALPMPPIPDEPGAFGLGNDEPEPAPAPVDTGPMIREVPGKPLSAIERDLIEKLNNRPR
jgi:hypothetical protein